MPVIIFVLIFLSILTLTINLNTQKTIEVNKTEQDFQKNILNENKKRTIDSLNILYNNEYGTIHGNTFTSNLIKGLANQEGDEKEVFLFNKNKFCVYTIEEKNENKTINQNIEVDKNLSCSDIEKLEEKFNYLGYELNEEEKNILEDLKNIVSNKYYLRVDVESILEFKNLNLPVLNLFIYDINKRFLPSIKTEYKVETYKIVNDKINESKFLLDQIANGIVEKGKRVFKGYIKNKNYSNTNAFTNLAEGVYYLKNGVTTYKMMSDFAESGFQTGNLIAIPTRYMTTNTEFDFKTNIISQWENDENKIDCDFVNNAFKKDNTIKWYSDNSYYSCKIINTNSLIDRFEQIKPDGYCSLEDMCAIYFELDNKGKIIGNEIKTFTLKNYLENTKYGFSFDMTKFSNPFFPKENFIENNNFILSSTNGNNPEISQVGLNLGLKVIARPFGLRTQDNITLSDKVDYENNYLINKYYIVY